MWLCSITHQLPPVLFPHDNKAALRTTDPIILLSYRVWAIDITPMNELAAFESRTVSQDVRENDPAQYLRRIWPCGIDAPGAPGT
ncbi:hypothetical protein PG993_009100 [Apiospora rasikravindrae]|uniref:Uncharacterized protein n=1 Tax=Apiospora rasikravindrae TaxID=990691 RepID=A0ABR1SIE8_9PEZI